MRRRPWLQVGLLAAVSGGVGGLVLHLAQDRPTPHQPRAVRLAPPPSTFSFPDLGTGAGIVSVRRVHDTTYYEWSLVPPEFSGSVEASYSVILAPQAPAAQRLNAAFRQALEGQFGSVTALALVGFAGTPLAAPALHAWGYYLPLLHCNAGAGVAYRTIVIRVGFTSQDHADTCTRKADWTLRLQLRLLRAAQSYGRAH